MAITNGQSRDTGKIGHKIQNITFHKPCKIYLSSIQIQTNFWDGPYIYQSNVIGYPEDNCYDVTK